MDKNPKNSKKTQLQIELENEAKAKEIIDREQIKELNRAMAHGLDLNKAAKSIYGNHNSNSKGDKNNQTKKTGELRLKTREEINFNQNWHE